MISSFDTIFRHFLQSSHWMDFQKAQGKEVVSDSGEGWAYSGCFESGDAKFSGTRLYLPYGPTINDKKSLKLALDSAKVKARSGKATYIRVEPMGDVVEADLKKLGLIKVRNMQPALTWQLDLTADEKVIFSSMSGTNRNLWNTADKKGISFEITYDPAKLKDFLHMIHEMADRTGMKPHSDSYFEKIAEKLFPSGAAGLAFGYHHKKPIVSTLFFDDKEAGVRYYAHAGSFSGARKLQANSPLLTFLLLDAKRSGIKIFDFYGVSPENQPDHPWAGFSKFKRSFGGYEKKYVGTWELPINKLKYSFMSSSRKIAAKIRK